MNYKSIIGIGWDVGGWMGKKQGIAVTRWSRGREKLEWIGPPTELSLPADKDFTPEMILKNASGFHHKELTDDTMVVVAIDAPLGFPSEYIRLVNGHIVPTKVPTKEIESRLAYRDTERHIYQVFGKKPLSAAFDKLGNNCTVATSHINKWRKEYGFSFHPIDKSKADTRIIIEVYPALVKSSGTVDYSNLGSLLPDGVVPNTDAYDAAICSVLAVIYGAGGEFGGFPKLVGPPEGLSNVKTEGWIYYLPPKVKVNIK